MVLARLKPTEFSSRIITAGGVAVLTAAAGFAMFGLKFAVILVPILVAAILAHRMHKERLSAKTAEISGASRLHLATIEALATAIDARDQIGSGHVRRTQIYALGLGEALGLSEDEMSALRTGALLHDIGKLAVPDHILSKPDHLTPAELEKAKTHSTVGAAILSEIDFPYPVVPTVEYHHEWWDGSGYPHGVSGTAIPITARVLAIADTYDALRSDRPYRKALDREMARKQIAAGAGLQFDPHLVQIFLKNLHQIEHKAAVAGLAYEGDVDHAARVPGGFVEQIKQANREVFTLFELTREFGESDNLRDMCATLCRKVGDFVPFDSCAIFLLDETRSVAQAVHVEGSNKAVLDAKQIRAGDGATGFVLKHRQPAVNVNPDLDFSVTQLELIQEYATMASFPLIADGTLIGAVSVYTSALESYQEEHIRILETITGIAAGAIAKLQEHVLTKAHALTDPMTGLPNARSLQVQFEREVSRANRNETRFQMLMLDLDGFKSVNDSFGHKVGDKLLREVGRVIQGQLREYDFLGRYGGDEFMALVPIKTDEDVSDLCRRIETAVAEYRLPVEGDKTASVGVSIGAASYPGSGETFDQMIVAADRVMYKRKSGRKAPRTLKPNAAPVQLSLDDILSAGHAYPTERNSHGGFVVELDESAVISNAVN